MRSANWMLAVGLGFAWGCDDAAPAAGELGPPVCLGPACRDAAAPECSRNGDCPPGLGCSAAGRCEPDTQVCVDRQDCRLGEVCRGGRCVLATEADRGSPDGGAPADLGPDRGLPDQAPLDRGLPDQALLDRGLPDQALPDRALADQAPLDRALPDATPPDAAPLDLALPDAELPDAELPDAELPDAALPDAALPDAALPDAELPPPPRGIYAYTRLPVGGLGRLARVGFHPTGDYALVLESGGAVYAVDWATGEATAFAPEGRGSVSWEGLRFVEGGARAVLVGYRLDGGAETAVVAHFEDAAWRAGAPALAVQPGGDRPGERATAVDVAPDGAVVVLLSRRVGQGYNAILRGWEPAAGAYTAFVAATVTSAGCGGLAHVADEFGEIGALVTCGENGADLQLYRVLGGVGEWLARPGGVNTGNLGGVSAHPSRAYALVVGWSGRRVYRFEEGRLLPSASAPNYSRLGIDRVAFAPDGRRALVVGRAGVQPVRGTVIEYRHDLYRCPSVDRDCDLTEVSIPGFDQAPYNADGNAVLRDAAFHPGCDGGLLVGHLRDGRGLLVRFDIENGRACP